MRNRKLTNDQAGAVAMITVIFVAIVLTIVVTGFIRLSLSNQRESIDDDLTTRAFYAAESGVEDARTKLGQYVNGVLSKADVEESACIGTGSSLSNELESEYTCQLIDLSPASFQSRLDADSRPVLIPLRSTSGVYDQVRVEWHQQGSETGTGSYTLRNDSNLPPANSWADSPAVLRVELFRHSAGAIDSAAWRSGSNDESFFAIPHTSGVTSISGTFTATNNDTDLKNIQCTAPGSVADGDYACSMTINLASDSANWSNFMNVRALYAGSNIKVTLLSSSAEQDFQDVQALVDVTGRANDVFRRVEARIPLYKTSELEDHALLSGERICKYFPVTDDIADFPGSLDNPADSRYLCDHTF